MREKNVSLYTNCFKINTFLPADKRRVEEMVMSDSLIHNTSSPSTVLGLSDLGATYLLKVAYNFPIPLQQRSPSN
jgi:hypothetical protein